MKLLALDCSAVSASVSVWDGERMLGEWFLHIPQTHSQTLMPMVRDLLEMAGIPLADMEVFAVSVGPGSFTGVRIGVSCVKGMALPGNTPCVGVSTLEAMAHPLAGLPGTVCAVMDARCAQVYHARVFHRGRGPARRGRGSPSDSFAAAAVRGCGRTHLSGGRRGGTLRPKRPLRRIRGCAW